VVLMSWMLQPHNYGQALSRNLYNVGYRRTATYKGMEGLGQSNILDVNIINTYTDASGATFGVDSSGNVWSYATGQMVGPTPTAANVNITSTFQGPGGVTYGIDASGNVYNMKTGLMQTGQPGTRSAAAMNWTPWLLVGGGLLLVMLMARR